MFDVAVGEYSLQMEDNGLPDTYRDYTLRAQLTKEFDLSGSEGRLTFCAVAKGVEWPFLVVAQRYSTAGFGFHPGALLVPETNTLFLGAGTRLLTFDLTEPAVLWEDEADFGFWSWHQHGETVLMSAELELAAWTHDAKKLWSTLVEPPWSYTVVEDSVKLDVMGKISEFNLASGPPRT